VKLREKQSADGYLGVVWSKLLVLDDYSDEPISAPNLVNSPALQRLVPQAWVYLADPTVESLTNGFWFLDLGILDSAELVPRSLNKVEFESEGGT